MGQPYSCPEEVLRAARWDKEKFLESNLHVYGVDGTNEVVYKLKEEPEKGIGRKKENIQEEEKEELRKREREEQKNKEETFKPFLKVDLVLNTHALQITLFGPFYARTQY